MYTDDSVWAAYAGATLAPSAQSFAGVRKEILLWLDAASVATFPFVPVDRSGPFSSKPLGGPVCQLGGGAVADGRRTGVIDIQFIGQLVGPVWSKRHRLIFEVDSKSSKHQARWGRVVRHCEAQHDSVVPEGPIVKVPASLFGMGV